MFPYMGVYEQMLRRAGIKTSLTSDPWENINDAGIGKRSDTSSMRPWSDAVPDQSNRDSDGFTGYDEPGTRKRALYSGLLAAGTQLLAAAPKGDYVGGLSRGASAFSEAFAASKDNDVRRSMAMAEEKRRIAAEQREVEQERDRNEAHDIGVKQSDIDLEEKQNKNAREAKVRETTAKTADQQLADIQALAARNPKDEKLQTMARRALGFYRGEDSDLDKLAKLHEDMTGQAFFEDDYNRETAAIVGRKKTEIKEGVESDPRAAEARANRGLDLEAERIRISQQRANDADNPRAPKSPTAVQRFDRIQRLVKEEVDLKVKAAAANGDVVIPATLERWKAEALAKAEATVDAGLYNYDINGNLTRIDE